MRASLHCRRHRSFATPTGYRAALVVVGVVVVVVVDLPISAKRFYTVLFLKQDRVAEMLGDGIQRAICTPLSVFTYIKHGKQISRSKRL